MPIYLYTNLSVKLFAIIDYVSTIFFYIFLVSVFKEMSMLYKIKFGTNKYFLCYECVFLKILQYKIHIYIIDLLKIMKYQISTG